MTPDRPVRILQVAGIEATVQTLLLPLVKRLMHEGFEVHAGCARDVEMQRSLPIPVHTVPFSRRILSLRHLRALVRMTFLLRRERFDVVHVHTPIAALIGRIACWLAHVPLVVYTAHGFPFHEGTPKRLRRALVAIERFLALRMTDVLFVQSQEDVETAEKEGIHARRGPAIRIGNGVDVGLFTPGQDPSVREEFGFPAEAPLLVFVGRPVAEKGIRELLTAFLSVRSRVPGVGLLIVGTAMVGARGRNHLDDLRRRIDGLGLAESVRLAGARIDVERLLRGADLLVLPSHREGMPRSILEAMATGLPVVATEIRGCREEVVHGETGLLVPVKDPGSLAEAIGSILADDEMRASMGAAARRRAEELFDEESVLDRQVAELRRLLEDRPGKASPAHSSPPR
jgi:glycosyltransferase involved in cell wall biosynthesis